MVKKSTKVAAKAAKKAKAVHKNEQKHAKKSKSKSKSTAGAGAGDYDDDDDDDEDNDLEAVLEKMRREWEDAHAVTEELATGPPSRRANATLTPCPLGNHLWCIGGEFFSDDGKAYFYNDVFRYSPEKDEWRRFVSKTCPGPRSAHAVVATPSAGGKIFLFGGEFSSLHQTTFHHYRDFWVFDIATHVWDRIDTKVRPSARSGHRMAMWKHYIVLFGGFFDPGVTMRYLNDLWVFDIHEYKWIQIEFKNTDPRPSPRSGFSFLPCPDGILLHGGYCKEYINGKRPVGITLDDTWFLSLSLPTTATTTTTTPGASSSSSKTDTQHTGLVAKWTRRKNQGYAPTPARAGCTMALWGVHAGGAGRGVLFGGVTDEERGEEGLDSRFWNELYVYDVAGKGRWMSMVLRKRKKGRVGRRRGKRGKREVVGGSDSEVEGGGEDAEEVDDGGDEDEPSRTMPIARYNAMLAVLRNTLYIYGGTVERGSREYTLDDFYALQLEKMERYVCLRECGVVIPEGEVSSSEDEDDSDGDDDDEEEEEEERDEDKDAQDQAQAQDEALDSTGTPLPGETLAMFYARTRDYWSAKALEQGVTESRGKMLRRDGFVLAEERYVSYKPTLEEVEKILAEAGLDEEEMRQGGKAGTAGQSRNRR